MNGVAGRREWLDDGSVETISERPNSVPTHDDLTIAAYLAFAHASYLELLRIRGSAILSIQ